MKSLIATLVVLCATLSFGQSTTLTGSTAPLLSDHIQMLHEMNAQARELGELIRQADGIAKGDIEITDGLIAVNRQLVVVEASINPPSIGTFQVAAGGHSASLSWKAGTCPTGQTCGAPTGWNVYRSTGGGSFVKIGNTAPGTLSFIDNSPEFQIEGTTYGYAATAFNTAGESAKSNTVTATVPTSPPGVPPTMNPPVVQ